MGMNEIDHTIYPYTVGREDCKVLPRSFKTLAEAEAYFAMRHRNRWMRTLELPRWCAPKRLDIHVGQIKAQADCGPAQPASVRTRR